MIDSYRDLQVWQKAMDFVVECYEIAREFPKAETYGLCSQLQRAAVSVPANIAEGRSRRHTREFVHHLSIAYGSLTEAETHLQSPNGFVISTTTDSIKCYQPAQRLAA